MLKEIFSFIFDRITDPLSLPIDATKEWIILGLIGFIAYVIAYRFIGRLYSSDEIHGSVVGSLLHWTVRGILFVMIWAVTYGIIVVGKFVINNWLWVCITSGVAFAFIVLVCVCKRYCRTT